VSDRIEGAWFRRSPAGAAILTVIALGFASWTGTGSELFAIQEVNVTGADELAPREVERLSGVQAGQNILRLSTDEVAARIAASPWVAGVRVSRSLPSTVKIELVERRPVGWLADPVGRVAVAADGVVLERLPSEPSDLPALGAWSAPLTAWDRPANLEVTLGVAASLRGSVLGRISEVTTEGGDVFLGLREGGEVRYGAPVELEEKGRTLTSLLAWVDARGIEDPRVDLQIPSAPALTPGP
jgi:cell division protein FtsQ